MVEESAGPLPMSPVTSAEPEESLTLVPYGAAQTSYYRVSFSLVPIGETVLPTQRHFAPRFGSVRLAHPNHA